MPEYTVKQGDHLAKIAKAHGFSDYRVLWDHPDNSELKKKRKNPNVLYPGDVVNIPDQMETKEVQRNTEKRHSFVKKGKAVVLRLELRHWNNRPMADTPCELEIEGKVISGTTNSKGRVEIEIPPDAENGKLRVKDTAYKELPLKIGHLDPVEEITGQKGRLNNLGYNSGPVDNQETEQFRSAIEEFQCDAFKNISQVDGKCGPKTQKKLKESYGC